MSSVDKLQALNNLNSPIEQLHCIFNNHCQFDLVNSMDSKLQNNRSPPERPLPSLPPTFRNNNNTDIDTNNSPEYPSNFNNTHNINNISVDTEPNHKMPLLKISQVRSLPSSSLPNTTGFLKDCSSTDSSPPSSSSWEPDSRLKNKSNVETKTLTFQQSRMMFENLSKSQVCNIVFSLYPISIYLIELEFIILTLYFIIYFYLLNLLL
jgi:hypothetical protein